MIIQILLPVSLAFIMFTLGIGLTVDNFKNVINYPKAFLVGIINQMFILPLVTFFIVIISGLKGELAVGMMILSCCPGGVTSNIVTKLAKGDTALSISYTAIISIVTVFSLPLIVGFSISHFMSDNAPDIPILKLALEMFLITTIPVLMGLYINTKHKNISTSFGPIASKISIVLFSVVVLGALAKEWNLFIETLPILGPAITVLIILMLFIGYNSPKLFRINKTQSITIAIESGIQNATVGIAIGAIIAGATQEDVMSSYSLPSAVYGILMYIVCLPAIFLFFKQK